MSSIVRYILRQLVVGMILVTLGLTFIIWLTQSLKIVETVVNKGASFGLFLKLTLLMIPNFLPIILPVALFSVVLFTYNKLISDRELVVLRAAGLSHMTLARPVLLLALLNILLGLILNIWVIPETVAEFRKMQFLLRSNASGVMLQEGQFTQLGNGTTVYVRARNPEGELLGIIIHDQHNRDRTMTIMAERGAFIKDDNGVPKVLLFNGMREQVSHQTNTRPSMLYFDSYAQDLLPGNDDDQDRVRDARERSMGELLAAREDQVGAVAYRQFRVEAHTRVASPLYHVGYGLIAAASLLCGWFNRRGQADRLILAVGLMILIQALALGANSLALRNLAFVPLIYVTPTIPALAAFWAIVRPSLLSRAPTRRLERAG